MRKNDPSVVKEIEQELQKFEEAFEELQYPDTVVR